MISASWLLSLGETLVTKISETILNDAYKKWIADSKSLQAKHSLISLYDEVSALENSSGKFVKLLDDFIKKEKLRKTISANRKGDKWHLSWGRALARQAEEVDKYMQSVLAILTEQLTAMKIHAPSIVEDLEAWKSMPKGESFIAPIVATSIGEIALDGSEPDNSITFEEFCSIAERLKEAINSLSETKKSLAAFIKDNFTFREIL